MTIKPIGYFSIYYKLGANIDEYNGILFIVLLVENEIHLIVNTEFTEVSPDQLRQAIKADYNLSMSVCSDSVDTLKTALFYLENVDLQLLATWYLGYDLKMLSVSGFKHHDHSDIVSRIKYSEKPQHLFRDQYLQLTERYNNLKIVSALPFYAEKNEKQPSYQLYKIIENTIGLEYLRPIEELKDCNGFDYHQKAQTEYKIPYIIEGIYETIALQELNNQLPFIGEPLFNPLK